MNGRTTTIRARRLEKRLSQERAAWKAKIDMQAWSEIERGERTPEPATLKRIAAALECDPGSIVFTADNTEQAPGTLTYRNGRFAHNLKALMDAHGLNVPTFQKRVGLPAVDQVYKWLDGRTYPQESSVRKLAAFFRVDPAELMEGEVDVAGVVPKYGAFASNPALAKEYAESCMRVAQKRQAGQHFQGRHPETHHPALRTL